MRGTFYPFSSHKKQIYLFAAYLGQVNFDCERFQNYHQRISTNLSISLSWDWSPLTTYDCCKQIVVSLIKLNLIGNISGQRHTFINLLAWNNQSVGGVFNGGFDGLSQISIYQTERSLCFLYMHDPYVIKAYFECPLMFKIWNSHEENLHDSDPDSLNLHRHSS